MRDYTNREQTFRHGIANRAADYDFKQLAEETKAKTEGRRVMGVFVFGVLAAAVILIATGHSVEGLVAVLVTLASLTGVYVYGPLKSPPRDVQTGALESAEQTEPGPLEEPQD